MTFFHFINCMLLTFAPPVILYKFSCLSEYGTMWRCGGAAGGYLIIQTCKLFIMASLDTTFAGWGCILDAIGLYWFLIKQQKASLAQVKILSVAIGWTLGESVVTRFLDFYVNARSTQFDWKYVLSAVEANVNLVENICLCYLLWRYNASHVTHKHIQRLCSILIIFYLLVVNFVLPASVLWKLPSTLALAVISVGLSAY